jgi:hypothetical protein
VGNGEGVLDERLAGEPALAPVGGLRHLVGPLDQPEVGLGVVSLDLAEQAIDPVGLARGLAGAQAGEEAPPPLHPYRLRDLHARLLARQV